MISRTKKKKTEIRMRGTFLCDKKKKRLKRDLGREGHEPKGEVREN